MPDVSEDDGVIDRPVSIARRARLLGFYGAAAGAVLLLAVPMAPFLVIPVAWPVLSEQLGIHQFHDIGVASLLWLMLIGLAAQFWKPRRQVAAMQQTLIVVLIMVGATALARPGTLLGPLLLPFGLAFLAATLHPLRGQIVQVGRRFDAPVFALFAMGAGPLLVYAAHQLRLDSTLIPLAAHGGHWTAMATLAAAILALALLLATRPPGWRIPAWSAGSAAMLFGVASFSLQHQASSVGRGWSLLAVAWGASLIVVSERGALGVRRYATMNGLGNS
jgi:hypothetical protein